MSCCLALDEQGIDAVHRRMAGSPAASPKGLPFDAFWGARYAIVADPDGNDVGLMSPAQDSRRTWPPRQSPAPAG